ncbi:uracil-DNA glycosylase [Luteolibacter flavescens]|uniref:Type-4 uracil-DNA glycosylase n=1 Tax=Luteolibacter flavescens TaxID=1859460 RepID=A0ABT3FVS7_9BACT|nr:uracil-DNA glycosylase [Luteolibacter flavescens]MCW1887657.1 uracil-DNA glycosylase [Luteolibacter flavescens]
MSRPVDALLDFLRGEEARGVTHIHLDDDAKALLRELHRRARAPKAVPASAAVVSRPAESVAVAERPAAAPAEKTELFVPEISAPAAGSAAERIAALAAQAENWAPARKLGTLRTTMVFSTGNPEADLMLVGEAPGYQEELQGEPFVGPAGQKLNDILKAMGLAREQTYISNIVKFRPATAGQTTNNRKPTLEEMASCLSFVRTEVEIVKPRCIVALGGTAAEGLLGLTGSVSAMRGKWYEFNGIPVRVTYHPSYLLRSTSVRDKRAVWEDMMEAMEKLDMPISERQRAFFQQR